MSETENSLNELEKAKLEILKKLQELEVLEANLKKQTSAETEKSEESLNPPAETPESSKEITPEPVVEEPKILAPEETPQVVVEPTVTEKPTPIEIPVPQPVVETPQAAPEPIIEEQPEPIAKKPEELVKDVVVEQKEPVKKEEKAKPVKLKKRTKADIKQEKLQEKERKKLELLAKKKDLEKQRLEKHKISVANRVKGKVPAEPGNTGVKQTAAEVFVYVVDDNELQLKVLQEQFKNTKSFKKTKGFTNGKDLLEYIKTRKFPKRSIILVIMDYFLEDSDDEESQNGIAVLNELKQYDPSIEVIMLSSSSDVDIAASASYFGAVTFIQKGKDAMKKILNNMIWTITDQEKIRKKAETKKILQISLIVFISIIVSLLVIDYFTHMLNILPVPEPKTTP